MYTCLMAMQNMHQQGGLLAFAILVTIPAMTIPASYVLPFHGTASATGWSTGLCHSCDDTANCFITCFYPCVTFGQIAEIVDKGSIPRAASGAVYGLLALRCLSCLYSCVYRSRLRGQYDLEEAPCADCLIHFCYVTCSLFQEYRELKNRGFDMGIDKLARLILLHISLIFILSDYHWLAVIYTCPMFNGSKSHF